MGDYKTSTLKLIRHYERLAQVDRAAGPLIALLLAANFSAVYYHAAKVFMLPEALFCLASSAVLTGIGALAGEKFRLINMEKRQRLLKDLQELDNGAPPSQLQSHPQETTELSEAIAG